MSKVKSDYVQSRLAEIAADASLRSRIKKPLAPVAPPRHGTKKGHIYFITAGDDEIVKIGFAANPDTRLQGLQTGSVQKLHPQFSFYSYVEAEKIIHDRFKADRIRGEWFNLTCDMEEMWDDFYDYQGFYTDTPLDQDHHFNLDEVRFISSTINQKWDGPV